MIKPNLTLDFTSAILDPRITFTRATTATFTGSDGLIQTAAINAPRFDYNPTTLAPLGLLIEEQRTNLLTYSEQFNNASWIKSNSSVSANATVSPDGTTNADRLIPSVAATDGRITQSFTGSIGATYTLTAYGKADTFSNFRLYSDDGALNSASVSYNLATGAITTAVGSTGTWTNASSTITPVGNGWYRASLTWTAAIKAPTRVVIWCRDTGNGTSGIYIWGAQLETGAFPTSYIPTAATAVTRNADVATITGTDFSDFWQSTCGGVLVRALPSTVSGIRPLVQFDDNTADNIIALRGNTTNPELYIVDGGAPQAQIDAGTIAANTAYNLTGWWDTNDCKARQNSGVTVSDYTATIPTVTQMRIGSDGTNYLNGTIATINYYDSFFGQPIYTRRKNKVFPSLL